MIYAIIGLYLLTLIVGYYLVRTTKKLFQLQTNYLYKQIEILEEHVGSTLALVSNKNVPKKTMAPMDMVNRPKKSWSYSKNKDIDKQLSGAVEDVFD